MDLDSFKVAVAREFPRARMMGEPRIGPSGKIMVSVHHAGGQFTDLARLVDGRWQVDNIKRGTLEDARDARIRSLRGAAAAALALALELDPDILGEED